MSLEEITEKLKSLEEDMTMVTESTYSPNANDYPNNRLPFVEVHLAYLRKNKQVNTAQYSSNLEIMIKKR